MLAPHFNRGPVFNWPSWSGVMRDEYAKQSAPKPPRCVGWARPMRLARRTSRFGRLPVLYTFQCRECSEWHTEEGDTTVPRSDLGFAA